MSNVQHTPEPWKIRQCDASWMIQHYTPGQRFKIIARTSDGTTAENEANARRIVAAVNACKGIPTEALEAGAIAELILLLKGILVAPAMTKEDLVELISDGRQLLAKLEGK